MVFLSQCMKNFTHLGKTLTIQSGSSVKVIHSQRLIPTETISIADTGRQKSMSEYTPDNWVMIKLAGPEGPKYKVLAGWSGGYLDGDSWRLNSGVTAVHEDEAFYYFYGSSGSCYRCSKDSYTLRMNNAHIWQVMDDSEQEAELMPADTDWMTIEWEMQAIEVEK
jgi:hypothetical protein